MNDWSRLAVDPQTMQKTRAEERTAKYKYAPDMAVQGAPIRSVSYQGSVGRTGEDNSVCP